MTNLWKSADHALSYLERCNKFPHRTEGEAVVIKLCVRVGLTDKV